MSVFRDKESLTPKYIPEKLPHRDKEINLLYDLYRDFSYSRVIQLEGQAGTGKTSTAHLVGMRLNDHANKENVYFKYVYVNLKLEAPTRFVLYKSIVGKVDRGIVSRSVSAEELLNILIRYLVKRNLKILLAVDEIDYYVKSLRGGGIVYDLTRLNEIYGEKPTNIIGVIFISRDKSWKNVLNSAEKSSLGNIVIEFNPYNAEEVYDIVNFRVEKAFKRGAVSNSVIEYVSDLTVNYANSDIRYALDLLYYAGIIAENEGSNRVTVEHIRTASGNVFRSITTEDLMSLTRDEIYILLATAIALKSKRNAYVSIEDIYDEYASLCEQYQIRLKNRRKFIEVLESLSNKGMIDIRSITKISINVPVEKLEKFLDALINRLDNALHNK